MTVQIVSAMNGFGARRAPVSTITFTAGGTGAAGTTTTLFTVTGSIVVLYTYGVITTDLQQSAGTPSLAYGVIGDVDFFVGATTATAMNSPNLWIDNSPAASHAQTNAATQDSYLASGNNVTCTVGGTNNISAGVIDFFMVYLPMSADASVVAA